jgi:hypothetical protein
MGRSRPRARGYRSWGTTPEAALGAQFLWDAARGVWADPGTGEIPITDGALVVAADEQVGGLLVDRAVEANPAKQYAWTESNPDFGGYPTIGDNVDPVRDLQAVGSAEVAQPCTLVYVGRWTPAANSYVQDASAATQRIASIAGTLVDYQIYAGTALVTALVHVFQWAQAEVLYWRVDGPATTLERYLRDGTRVAAALTTGNPGANGVKGFTWKTYRTLLGGGMPGQAALYAYVPGLLSATRQTAFEAWLRTAMPGWQP